MTRRASSSKTRSGRIYLQATRVMFSGRTGRTESGPRRAWPERPRSPRGDIDPDVHAYLLQATAEAALLDGRPIDALRAVEDGLAEFAGSDEQLLRRAAAAGGHGRRGRPRRPRPGVPRPVEVAAARRRPALLEQARALESTRPLPTPSVNAAVATVEAE